jgi:hypothetical protein
MPEVSEDATLLIATSWQALKRARSGDDRTMLCNCIVVIVFAAFFIEANLNHIVEALNKEKEMSRFLGNRHPGLQDKLAWFYNRFVARSKAANRKQMYRNGIERKLRTKFPGFNEIYKFRNDISHGTINRTATNINNAEKLRRKAKAIVDELYRIIAKTGNVIPRSVTYEVAISSND